MLVVLLAAASFCRADGIDPAADAETRRLLNSVDQALRQDLTAAQEKLRQDQAALLAPLPAFALAINRDDVERERKELLKKVDEWSTSSAVLLDITVTSKDINPVFLRSEAIARYYGVDVVKYRRFFELGKGIIRDTAFEIPDRPLPERDGTLSGYFFKLFAEATLLSDAIADAARRNQDYRVGLFKKATFAYMRALLKSGEPLPQCESTGMNTEVQLNGQTIRTLGCPDPMLDDLRKYINALRTIQSADSETFAAEGEKIAAQQQVTADILAVVPVVGDSLDLVQLYMGESLSGQCLSPFEKSLTALFTFVPLVGPSLFQQAVKRSDRVALAAQKMDAYFEALATWGTEYIEGFAKRHELAVSRVESMIDFMHNTRVEIEMPDRTPSIPRHSAELEQKFKDDKVIYQTLRAAEEAQAALAAMPRELREQALARARKISSQNLDALQGGRAAAINASNMVASHLDEIEQVAKQRGEILIFRHVNAEATALIEQGYLTKGMNVKGKSADWGPQKGFIPVDQSLSKLGNPANAKLDGVIEFQEQVKKCLNPAGGQPPCAFKMELPRADGALVKTVPGPDGGSLPVLLKDGKYIDPETGDVLNLTPRQIQGVQPLEVLAGYDANGVLVPLTADYDFLAMGRKRDVRSPNFKDGLGFVNDNVDAGTLDAVNAAVARHRPEGSGNVSHHGAENWFPKSPGALGQDPVVTVVDPDRGLISVPRCGEDCMRKWCDTTRQCSGMPLCAATDPSPPCIPIDPDRLLKDYFHEKRLDGFSLFPNSRWDWGPYNELGGWTMNKFLAHPGVSRFMTSTIALRAATRRGLMAGVRLVGSLFECGPQTAENPQ